MKCKLCKVEPNIFINSDNEIKYLCFCKKITVEKIEKIKLPTVSTLSIEQLEKQRKDTYDAVEKYLKSKNRVEAQKKYNFLINIDNEIADMKYKNQIKVPKNIYQQLPYFK